MRTRQFVLTQLLIRTYLPSLIEMNEDFHQIQMNSKSLLDSIAADLDLVSLYSYSLLRHVITHNRDAPLFLFIRNISKLFRAHQSYVRHIHSLGNMRGFHLV